MLASTGPLPRGPVSWEPKWDGFRAQALVDGVDGRLRIVTRSGRCVESGVPELAALAGAVGPRRLALDGELVVGDGSPSSFYRLGGRLAVSKSKSVKWARQRDPVTLVIFDVLWADGELLGGWPYRQRRALRRTWP